VNGAKNDALKVLPASFLFKDELTIKNIPHISDIDAMSKLITELGAVVKRDDRTFVVNTENGNSKPFPHHIAKQMRSSSVLMGPILARFGEVSFPHPGGCVLGARPIDLFVNSFEKMGAECTEDGEYYHLSTKGEKLKGADIFLDIASVGATETIMMAAVLAEGTTYIRNAAMEPEIQNLATFLAACGAKIEGIGSPTLRIEGGPLLSSSGNEYSVIPDRLEAGSFAILGALAAKELTITNCNPDHLRALLSVLDKVGVDFSLDADKIVVRGGDRYTATSIRTHEYPGIATDIQAPLTVLLTQAEGESLVHEIMFEGRLHYTEDLIRMGADIMMLDSHRVLVRGPSKLSGKEMDGPDLRAGLAYVIAGIIAKGTSTIHNAHLIDRGYECVADRFSALGATISRISE